METRARRFSVLAILLLLPGVAPLTAQSTPQASVMLAASGSFARGGSFAGTATINRFEQRGNEIVAIGFVRGTLSRGGRSMGTAFAGEVAWPVKISVRDAATARRSGPATAQFVPASWASAGGRGPVITLIQASCPVLEVALGAVDVNLLGVQVGLDPTALDLVGAGGTALGELVCAASALIGNVAGLVNLLNLILGLLTGLLGGLGGIPV